MDLALGPWQPLLNTSPGQGRVLPAEPTPRHCPERCLAPAQLSVWEGGGSSSRSSRLPPSSGERDEDLSSAVQGLGPWVFGRCSPSGGGCWGCSQHSARGCECTMPVGSVRDGSSGRNVELGHRLLLHAGALHGGAAPPCWGSPWWSSSSVLGCTMVEQLLHAGALCGEAAPPCWGSPWWRSSSVLGLSVVEKLLRAGARHGGAAPPR